MLVFQLLLGLANTDHAGEGRIQLSWSRETYGDQAGAARVKIDFAASLERQARSLPSSTQNGTIGKVRQRSHGYWQVSKYIESVQQRIQLDTSL